MRLRHRVVDGIKLAGLLTVIWYVATHPLQLDLKWIMVYLAITIGISVTYGSAIWAVGRLRRSEIKSIDENRSSLATHVPAITCFFENPVKNLVLLPGEDGLFYVPLLLIGIHPISAFIIATVFAAAHLGQYPRAYVIPKGIGMFLAALLVLPHGLLNVIVGHLMQDVAALLLSRRFK
jgi:hypothetical protein